MIEEVQSFFTKRIAGLWSLCYDDRLAACAQVPLGDLVKSRSASPISQLILKSLSPNPSPQVASSSPVQV